jgi:hypothetical protein
MAAGVPGVAAADAECAADRTAEGAVFLNGEDHVLAAGGMKAAVVPEPGADSDLVAADESDQQGGKPHGVDSGILVGVLFGVAEFE